MTPGTKVKIILPIDNYPDCYIEPGETGVFTHQDIEGAYWVKLDAHHPELEQWDNEVQIRDYSKQDPKFHPSHSIKAID